MTRLPEQSSTSQFIVNQIVPCLYGFCDWYFLAPFNFISHLHPQLDIFLVDSMQIGSLIDGILIGWRSNIGSPLTGWVTQGTPSVGIQKKSQNLFKLGHMCFVCATCSFKDAKWQIWARHASQSFSKNNLSSKMSKNWFKAIHVGGAVGNHKTSQNKETYWEVKEIKSNAGLPLQSSPCIYVLLQQSVGKMIILWIGDNDDFCPE